ncbi:MAG: hypothetical protein ACOCZ8_00865 [Bacteroidota bacterium]
MAVRKNAPLLTASAFVLLLVLAFVLRIPSFHSDFVTVDAGFYLIAAERIAEGGAQYVDTWDNKPPLITWTYTAFVELFGDNARLAIAIFTSLYLFVCAVFFNQFFFEFRLLRKFTVLPGALLLFFLSSPWYIQELNTELLCLLPMLLTVRLMAKHFVEDGQPKPIRLFWAGLLCAVCIAARYHGVFFTGGIVLSYIIVARFSGQDFVTLIGGVLTGLAIMVFVLVNTGAWAAFWEIGLLYNLDYVRQSGNPGEMNGFGNLIENLKLWGGLLLIATIGFFGLRVNFNKLTVNQRKVESLLFIWLVASLISMAVGGRFYLHYFYFALPAVMIYVVYALEIRLRGMWRGLAVIILIAFPLFTDLSYFAVNSPERHASIKKLMPGIEDGGWIDGLFYRLHLTPQEKALQADLQQRGIEGGIWIVGFEPSMYVRLNRKMALKYTNHAIFVYKTPWLAKEPSKAPDPLSGIATMPAVYRELRGARPAYVIDLDGRFARLKTLMPLLLDDYTRHTVGGTRVYVLEK